MKKIILMTLSLLAGTVGYGQIVPLWPDGAPGENGLTEVAREDGTFSHVTEAHLEFFVPDENTTGIAMVICPGGGYVSLAMNHEGRDVARWLNDRGIAAVVLKYRMPGGVNSMIPGEDVRKAIEVARNNAAELGADPAKIGVIGFSAGGHLASTALTHYTSPANRPDFGILVYPVISMKDGLVHAGSRKNLTGFDAYSDAIERFSNETRVTADTPPVLILFSDNDKTVDPRNGTAFYDAAKANGVPAELHIWPSGGHGWGWRESFAYSDEMKAVVERWLGERK